MASKRKSLESVEDFLWYLQAERRLAPHTLEAYRGDLETWSESGTDLEASEPPSDDILTAVLGDFERQGHSRATQSRRIAALRAYARYRALARPDWERLLKALPSGRAELSLPRALELEEIERLLDFDPGSDPSRLRNRTLLELLYASGLRVSEAIGLTWSHVDERRELVRVLGKGSKERWVPFTPRAAEWLNLYRDRAWSLWAEGLPRNKAEIVFLSPRRKPLTRMAVWKVIAKRALEAGLEGVHPHVLRHSFATHLLKGGADVRVVQMLLGHSSLAATERYLKMNDEDLRELFRKHHPLASGGSDKGP